MDFKTIRYFLMWNTILNGSILIIWTFLFAISADWIYQIHNKLFLITRDDFNSILYSLIGLFKIIFLIFNVVPLIVLTLMGRGSRHN